MYCKNCDKLLDDGVNRCHYCGTNPNHLPKQKLPYPENFPSPAPRKKRRGCLTAVGIVFAIMIISIVLGVVQDTTTEAQPTTTTLPATTNPLAEYIPVTLGELHKHPEDFFGRHIVVEATVDSHYFRGFRPGIEYFLEDESSYTGFLMLTEGPQPGRLIMPEDFIRVYGVFRGLEERSAFSEGGRQPRTAAMIEPHIWLRRN